METNKHGIKQGAGSLKPWGRLTNSDKEREEPS